MARQFEWQAIHKILVPVDGSDEGQAASGYAVTMARSLGASVTLAHVVEPMKLPTYVPGIYLADQQQIHEQQMEKGEATINTTLEQLGDAGVPVDTRLLIGLPGGLLVNLASEGDYDIIVMGHRGLSLARSLLLGSVSDYVVRNAPCPVLILRGKGSGMDTVQR